MGSYCGRRCTKQRREDQVRRYLARYPSGATRYLWAMSPEQAERQARFYGVPDVVVAVSG